MSHVESSENGLLLEEYKRYGRQMIVQGFGLPGTLKLYYQYLQYYRLLECRPDISQELICCGCWGGRIRMSCSPVPRCGRCRYINSPIMLVFFINILRNRSNRRRWWRYSGNVKSTTTSDAFRGYHRHLKGCICCFLHFKVRPQRIKPTKTHSLLQDWTVLSSLTPMKSQSIRWMQKKYCLYTTLFWTAQIMLQRVICFQT